MEIFIKGLILGFSIAAPVGPIGLLCIRRTLANGKFAGLVSGLGAATADGLYGCVAAFGLVAVSGFLTKYELIIKIAGSLFLFYLAVKIISARPVHASQKTASNINPAGVFFSTFLLTITNPATIISFIAAFAAFGVGSAEDFVSARLIVIGVFLGSAAWWLILSSFVEVFRNKLSIQGMAWINRVSGFVMIILGILGFIPSSRL